MANRKPLWIALIALSALIIGFSVQSAQAADAPETFQPVRSVLEMFPSGNSALALMDQYQVQVEFASGKGTYFLASDNSIVIESGHEPMRAALSFVHEINHAKFWHEGLRADISEMTEADYARLRVEEEAEGVVKSIEAKMELQKAGLDVNNLSYPLESTYGEAYQTARNAASAREKGITEAELAEIGRAGGKAAVIQGFMDGKVWTSHTSETYADFYGQCWGKADLAHQLLTPLSEIVTEATGFDLLATVVNAVSESC